MDFIRLKNCISSDSSINSDKDIKEVDQIENIQKRLINYSNLENDDNTNRLRLVKIYYLYRDIIHKQLYEKEEMINLNFNDKKEENLSYYFYISLLIKDKEEIINYSYTFEYIKEIFNQAKNDNDNDKYSKLIISKIILELINNYKQLDEDEYNNEELEQIENKCNKIISGNIIIFNELNINWNYEDLTKKKIDEIYSEIIIALIKNNIFENYEYTYNIIKQLDLESIDITNKMYEQILNILDNNKDIKNKYIISKIEDLFNDGIC